MIISYHHPQRVGSHQMKVTRSLDQGGKDIRKHNTLLKGIESVFFFFLNWNWLVVIEVYGFYHTFKNCVFLSVIITYLYQL